MTYVLFDGERGPLREKKLTEMVEEYSSKFRQDVRSNLNNVGLSEMSHVVKESLTTLNRDMEECKNSKEVEILVREAHLLSWLYDANLVMESGDFSKLGALKIDELLAQPEESLNLQSYGSVRARFMPLLK